ncbi:hypothetical protein [Geomonas sp.]|uniref:hypothetical protein n=1 Tax=Geomonas sp. TaxID=2651584 RepID=UPI002B488C7F|nr:hypothetical protein [Geomonas sp.]HJV34767.1 hypothetical protein [Geomonas sp.]
MTVAILSIGLVSALVIYLTAGEAPDNPLGDQIDTSKIYQRNMEMFAGKANLLGQQINDWFHTLWHGKPLALTVAVITIVVALLYRFIASPIPPDNR